MEKAIVGRGGEKEGQVGKDHERKAGTDEQKKGRKDRKDRKDRQGSGRRGKKVRKEGTRREGGGRWTEGRKE
jgi:hypothetical protein